jgi:hypothetical protein
MVEDDMFREEGRGKRVRGRREDGGEGKRGKQKWIK